MCKLVKLRLADQSWVGSRVLVTVWLVVDVTSVASQLQAFQQWATKGFKAIHVLSRTKESAFLRGAVVVVKLPEAASKQWENDGVAEMPRLFFPYILSSQTCTSTCAC